MIVYHAEMGASTMLTKALSNSGSHTIYRYTINYLVLSNQVVRECATYHDHVEKGSQGRCLLAVTHEREPEAVTPLPRAAVNPVMHVLRCHTLAHGLRLRSRLLYVRLLPRKVWARIRANRNRSVKRIAHHARPTPRDGRCSQVISHPTRKETNLRQFARRQKLLAE